MEFIDRLETKDLILGKAKWEDLESIFNNYWSSEKTAKYMLWVPLKNIEEAKERLNKTIEFQKSHFAFNVYDKSTGQVIGQAGMEEIEPCIFEDGGIGLGEKYVGKGYGKQILKCFIDYLFEKCNAKKIICSCFDENVASKKLQESCGLRFDHFEMYTREKDGATFKLLYNIITREDWLKLKDNTIEK